MGMCIEFCVTVFVEVGFLLRYRELLSSVPVIHSIGVGVDDIKCRTDLSL